MTYFPLNDFDSTCIEYTHLPLQKRHLNCPPAESMCMNYQIDKTLFAVMQ